MANPTKNVAVLGATGSIGRNALQVIAASNGRLRATAISGHEQADRLLAQAQEFGPKYVVVTDKAAAKKLATKRMPTGATLLSGQEGLEQVVADPEIDIILAAIVGAAGLRSTWAALEAGKTVALANKETLVMAGPLVGDLLKRSGGTLLPVDSEHSAVYQALKSGKPEEVHKVVLTASGGPFRTWPAENLTQVTVSDALSHPTWNMGPKITVDSATMMNKALEIIEARWLFNLPANKIDVMIHPQSILHSLVEFVDGSIISQMSPPDMKLPIHYALYHPERTESAAERFDWTQGCNLEMYPADRDRFPALSLGFECAEQGGSSGVVLNAANEAAVNAFLEGDLHFTEIIPACRSVLESHNFEAQPTLDQLMRLDAWARQEVATWVCA